MFKYVKLCEASRRASRTRHNRKPSTTWDIQVSRHRTEIANVTRDACGDGVCNV